MNSSQWHILFWNSDGKRLRPGWRLLIQLAMAGFLLLFQIFVFAFANLFLHWQIPVTGLFIITTIFQLIAFTGSIAMARRFLDHRPFLELGLHKSAKDSIFEDLFWGFPSAAIMLWVPFIVMYSLGWLHVLSEHLDIGHMLLYLLLFIVIGFQEELLFRGYILQTLASGWNKYFGLIGSSLIFAGLHALNPGFTWMAFLGIFCAGLLLGFAYLRTGQLWLSIGLHIGWNFFEAVVFGFPTSGVTIYALTRIHVSGPVLWTGGAFGPEAGLIILPALAIGAGLVWLYTK